MSVQIELHRHETQLKIYPVICCQGRHFLICESLQSAICPSLFPQRNYVAKKTFFQVFKFFQDIKCTVLKRILDMGQGDPFFRVWAVMKKFPMIHIHIEIDIDKFQLINNKECVDKTTFKENSSTVTRWMVYVLRTLDKPYRLFPYCVFLLIFVFILS
jgi:hypothetical protein